MDLIARVAKHFEDSAHTKLNAIEMMAAPIAAGIETMTNCLINGGKILACGNGGCDEGSICGACCKCGPGTPVCGVNYGTYGSECEASCAGVEVLHAGACLPYEGLGCDWNGENCAAGQYCRDPCPVCSSIHQWRCTKIGACVEDWDCLAGLDTVPCPDGNDPTWSCVYHACVAACPAP